jgi:predicted GNAT family acetyltransferase
VSAEQLLIVHTYPTAAAFLDRMHPLLVQHEVQYGLMLGVALAVQEQPQRYGELPPYLATVEDSGDNNGIAAAVLMTPPHAVVLYSERADPRPGLRAIAQDLLARGLPVPGANGREPLSRLFAEIWSKLTGATAEIAMRERVFALRQVLHPTYSPGAMRPATLVDLDLVAQWIYDFGVEALSELQTIDLAEARRRTEERIRLSGNLYLWEDGAPVSLAGSSRPTPHGIAIGPVYTPPAQRGRGYASSLVARLSQQLLDQGRDFVTLFTDLANPTSNHIYQAIGYRPVCDYTVYRFNAGVGSRE